MLMGELCRQNSRVWWSSFPGADESDSSGRPWVAALSPTMSPRPPVDSPARWDSPVVLATNRGDSSSPSQGSHGSQDSGFSDSELNNALNSPHDSPELSKRSDTQTETSTPNNQRVTFNVVEFPEDCCNTTPRRPHYNIDNEKINKIQNQLELSSQPKKFPSPETSISGSEESEEHTVIEVQEKPSGVDSDGFKIPKCVDFRGSCTSLNFAANPPVSCSTPKGPKGSPKFLRALPSEEKTKSFATVRKLKALSSFRHRRSAQVARVLSSGIENASPDTPHPVAQWLEDLESQYDAEIMTTLQSKSLASDLARQVTNMAVTTSDTVRKLHRSTRTISSQLTKLYQQMKCKKYSQVAALTESLIGHIKEFITEYVLSENVTANRKKEASNQSQNSESGLSNSKVDTVLKCCDSLRDLAGQKPIDHDEIDKERINLAKEFRDVVDSILLSHVKALVSVLAEPRTELALRTALSALCSLGLEGGQLSELVARCEGVRALLAVILEARATEVRVSALRALATVSCAKETIVQFQQAGGIEIMADLLSDVKRPEAEQREAAAVLAQVTAPWIEENPPLPELADHLPSLVISLSRMVESYRTSETLLLATAAIANLTFLEPRTVWCLLEAGSVEIILAAVRRQGPKVSVFIQEQAATILANMSAIPEARSHLARHRAVVALLCFLQIRHSPLQRAPEIAASERVQQKTAIALSRLCSEVTVAKQVVELQGVHRLVRLCKEEAERNHSDGVLVACLAALRKIVANCGAAAVEDLDALDLIEPRLLDSFLLFSSRQESYV